MTVFNETGQSQPNTFMTLTTQSTPVAGSEKQKRDGLT